MPKNRRTSRSGRQPGWEDESSRVRWLVDTRFGGNRSALAEAAGLSHTIVNQVYAGTRKPGRKVLLAIADRLGADPGWLLTGAGRPFRPTAMPLTHHLLPGPLREHRRLVAGEVTDVPWVAYSETQYWLLLAATEPAVRERAFGFNRGDRLLFETDPARFPPQDELDDRLCAVRDRGRPGAVRLATVAYHPADPDGPAHLTATPLVAAEPGGVGRREVYTHLPGGEIRHSTEPLRVATVGDPRRRDPAASPPRLEDFSVEYTDVVGVWTQVLHRSFGV